MSLIARSLLILASTLAPLIGAPLIAAPAIAGPGSSDDEAAEVDRDDFERDRSDQREDASGGRDRDDKQRDDDDREERGRDRNDGRDRGDGRRDERKDNDRDEGSKRDGHASDPDPDKAPVAASGPTTEPEPRPNAYAGADRAEQHLEFTDNRRGERIRRGELLLVSALPSTPVRLGQSGFRIIEAFELPGFALQGYRVAVDSGTDSDVALARLQLVDPAGIASYNHLYSPSRGHAAVAQAPAALSTRPRKERVPARIGLVDAPVNARHPMLSGVQVEARDFCIATPDADGHGTAVASRLAEAAPGASLYVASVFSKLRDGEEIASVDAIARALDWLSRKRIPVVNLSIAGPPNPVLQAVTARLAQRGHILVAAVGNEGPHGAAQYPAAYDGVIGVTAVDQRNEVYIYANRGDYVDFAAYGVGSRVAAGNGNTETVSGTSYAAPVVAAELARRLPHPDRALSEQAQGALALEAKDLGAPGRDPVYGMGLIEP